MTTRALTIILATAAGVGASVPGASGQNGTAAAAAPTSGPTFVVTGRGWGHGVGMSQYGALGYARKGWVYPRILAHYYPGTQLTRVKALQVRVLLAEGKSSVTVVSTAGFRVRDAGGSVHPLAAGEYRLGPGLKLKVDERKPAQALPGPLTFLPGQRPLQLQRPYRGWIQVVSNGRTLQAINILGLEKYLYGVVPDEVPDTWPAEALKAQAVAARSYALATRKTGGAFDVYADTRSQVYGGVNAESFTTTAAVDATSGQALTYRGRPAITYFFSTSGGRTVAVEDAWPGARPVPYLVSVPDPYDSLSPHHTWGPIVFSPKSLTRRLKIPGRIADVRTVQNPSGRVGSLVAVTHLGDLAVQGTDVRSILGLRSTWFRVGVLSLSGPAVATTYGSAARVTGLARGLGGASLQRRVAGGSWERAARISPAKDGSFAVSVKPTTTAEYRVAGGYATTSAVKLPVAALVRFALAQEAAVLRGMVRPVVAGAGVQIQRLTGNEWRVATTVKTDARGNFEVLAALGPGSYRARVSPGGGLVPGVSPVIKVVAS